jgi:hypothetical protein
VTAIQLNLPSINVPTMPGVVTVKRTVRNVTKRPVIYSVSGSVPAGSKISVIPPFGVVKPGQSQSFLVTIISSAKTGQYFGQINISPSVGPALHLPVAFFNKQGAVSLTSTCASGGDDQSEVVRPPATSRRPTNQWRPPRTCRPPLRATGLQIVGPRAPRCATAWRAGRSRSLARDAVPKIAGPTPGRWILDLLTFLSFRTHRRRGDPELQRQPLRLPVERYDAQRHV